MNILFTESSSDVGGQELQEIEQLQQLKMSGHSVLLACRKGSEISRLAINKNIDVIFISFRNSIHIASVLNLSRIIYQFKPDIVICHSGHDSNITGITRFVTFGKTKSFKIIRQKTYLTGRVKPFSLNYLCDTVITPSHFTKEALVNGGCKNKIRVVPPGFNIDLIEQFSHFPLPEHISVWLEQRKDIPVFLQVGMIRQEKGHIFMLDVLTKLRQQGRVFCWLIVGEGNEEDEMRLKRRIEKNAMQDNVLMAGNIFPVFPVYKIASLVVIPSTNESFGMVAAEAALNSVPVLANRIGGLSDIIKHQESGTLLCAGDNETWLNSLNSYLDTPEPFYKMASCAKKYVEYKFNIKNTVIDLIK